MLEAHRDRDRSATMQSDATSHRDRSGTMTFERGATPRGGSRGSARRGSTPRRRPGVESLINVVPPNHQWSPCSPLTARGCKELSPPDEEDASSSTGQMMRVLRMREDPRFREMANYQETQSSGKNEHFENLKRRRQAPQPKLRTGVTKFHLESSLEAAETRAEEFRRLAERELAIKEGGKKTPWELSDRIEWQERFDINVRQLHVDFELANDPSSSLNHLDRMYSWFDEQGGKQTRKAREGPSYLTADRRQELPPGAARDIEKKPGRVALVLAGDLMMRRSVNLPQVDGLPKYSTGPVPRSARG